MGQSAPNTSPRRFSISTPSRHPANQNGYDAISHRYRADYVNPKFWILNLDASPGLPKSPTGDVQVPDDVSSFSWTVKQVGGPFTLSDHRTLSPIWKTDVQIPEPGEYEITLQVNLTGGGSEINTRRYRLRDFLVVSIGDSFSAGQGNPDIPANSSPDEKALCKPTTLNLGSVKIADEINDFRRKVENKTKETVEDYLPFIGKMIVADLNGVEDVVGFVKDGTESLGDAVVEIAKSAVGLAVHFLSLGFIGSDEFESRPARWQEPRAYRSYRSGHSLAARQVEAESESGADRITFLSFARSGSRIRDGLIGPRTTNDLKMDGWTGNRGQVQEASDTVLNRPIDALIITIGVNDLGFTGSLSKMLEGSFFSGTDRTKIASDIETKRKKQMPLDFAALKQTIDTHLTPRQVFITQWPTGLFTKLDGNGQVHDGGPCGIFSSSIGFNMDVNEGRTLRQLGKNLNSTIRDTADKFGWIFIDGIERDFDGHGYCAGKPYFVSAEESCLNQGDFEGMVHPNEVGHEVTRDRIAHALNRHLLAHQENWLEPMLHVMMR